MENELTGTVDRWLQPNSLENERARLIPLKESDFDRLYALASDPAVWEQHPNQDRWKREVFIHFFEGAVNSGTAFLIFDKESGELAGSTRYYGYEPKENSLFIGYTFYAKKFWGTGLNPLVKGMMIDYAFSKNIDSIYFHVGAVNKRSQVAVERLGAVKVKEIEMAYYGEPVRPNFLYQLKKIAAGKGSQTGGE